MDLAGGDSNRQIAYVDMVNKTKSKMEVVDKTTLRKTRDQQMCGYKQRYRCKWYRNSRYGTVMVEMPRDGSLTHDVIGNAKRVLKFTDQVKVEVQM
jgi:hypothetical protein